jgi:hypothetical protein
MDNEARITRIKSDAALVKLTATVVLFLLFVLFDLEQ